MLHRSNYLLAVDPSLTCSGWALFDLESERLLAVGKVKSLPPSFALSDRLLDLHGKVQTVLKECELKRGDFMICEAPTTMRDPRAALRVEQVRGIFEATARNKNVTVPGRINPRSVQREVMGLKGRQLERSRIKETAVIVVQALYEEDFARLGFPSESASLARHQDIVDAVLVGRLGVARVKAAKVAGVPPHSLFTEKMSPRARMPKIRSGVVS